MVTKKRNGRGFQFSKSQMCICSNGIRVQMAKHRLQSILAKPSTTPTSQPLFLMPLPIHFSTKEWTSTYAMNGQ